MKDEEKNLQRAWCEYRGIEYVEDFCNPLPSDNFAAGYRLVARDSLSNQWHYIYDKDLPQRDNDVLVAYKSRYTDTIMYGVASYNDKVWYTEDDAIPTSNILAWMPIPQFTTSIISKHENN